jgi:hypothetical protein
LPVPVVAVQVTLPVAGSSAPHSFTASAGPDTPSDEDASADAARSQDFLRFKVMLDSPRR